MIELRSIKESDIDDIKEVALSAWNFTYKDIFPQKYIDDYVEKNYSKESLVSLIPKVTAGEQLFDVALENSRIIGFCSVGLTSEGFRLYRIYLLPRYIGKGVGKKLLDRAKAFVRSKGENKLFCFVHKNNRRGVDFYLQSGFKHRLESDQGDEWYMELITDLR
jgi:ribosomal protein S18 acetylase RimI-like enzyme